MNDEKQDEIPCLGYWTYNSNAHDFDCGYDTAIVCENCMVNGGSEDPRKEADNDNP